MCGHFENVSSENRVFGLLFSGSGFGFCNMGLSIMVSRWLFSNRHGVTDSHFPQIVFHAMNNVPPDLKFPLPVCFSARPTWKGYTFFTNTIGDAMAQYLLYARINLEFRNKLWFE